MPRKRTQGNLSNGVPFLCFYWKRKPNPSNPQLCNIDDIMKMQINESPDELKGNQAGSKASGKRKKDVSYIEVVPSLPTYHMEDIEITKVLKLLFEPEKFNPVKEIIEYNMGFCHIVDYEPGEMDDFSTLRDHPDTVESYQLEQFLFYCNLEEDFAADQLAEWGITKVAFKYKTDKIVSTKVFFEAYKILVQNKANELIIKCEDGEELRFPYRTMYRLREDSK